MTDLISAEEFLTSPGTADWTVAAEPALGATATFLTGSFTAGVELVDAIGELAEAANHHPDVDLRFSTVMVRLVSHDAGGLTRRDAELAAQVSAAAHELDIPARPAQA